MSNQSQHNEAWEHALAELLKDAHDQLGKVSLRQVARDLELSHAALVRVRQGDLGAVSRETLLRVLDYYGLKPPSELLIPTTVSAERILQPLAAFCTSPQCPLATVYFVNERWVVRPLTLRVPGALFEGGREPVCRECGSLLAHRCPECGQEFKKGAFCPWCSAGYVSVSDIREHEFPLLREQWLGFAESSGKVEEY